MGKSHNRSDVLPSECVIPRAVDKDTDSGTENNLEHQNEPSIVIVNKTESLHVFQEVFVLALCIIWRAVASILEDDANCCSWACVSAFIDGTLPHHIPLCGDDDDDDDVNYT